VVSRDTSSGQNDTREPSNPQTVPNSSKEDVKDVDMEGPCPKPLETMAMEHGGDAGNMTTDGQDSGGEGEGEGAGEDENGVQKVSHGSGTGEQWIKSSGLKADGGNFDAAAPGAGKEADREFFLLVSGCQLFGR
jgi:hypothetical protein